MPKIAKLRDSYYDRLLKSLDGERAEPVSYTHLRAHETVLDLVCRLLLEKKKTIKKKKLLHLNNDTNRHLHD